MGKAGRPSAVTGADNHVADAVSVASSSTLSSASPPRAIPGTSRKRSASPSLQRDGSAKKPALDGNVSKVYCHHCRQARHPDEVIRCTRMKQVNKAGKTRPCNLAWCLKDLERRYAVHPPPIPEANGLSNGTTIPQPQFTCPCCRNECRNSQCHKQKNKAAATAMVTNLQVKYDSSTFVRGGSESTLSSLTSENDVKAAALPKANAKPKKTARSGVSVTTVARPNKANSIAEKSGKDNQNKEKTKPKKDAKSPVKKAARDGQVKGASKKQKTGKDKKTVKAKAKGDEIKPKKEVVPTPPTFEKVETSLSLESVKQRMALREFLFRFRAVLSIPERALGLLDDFDRALTEASVRLFAGAMLEIIRNDMQAQDPELDDIMFRYREELRYYADLARFAAIYNDLEEALELKLARSPPHRSLEAVASDIPPEVAAFAAPPRRTGASRIPQPQDIIRMLLAFAERSLATAEIRYDLESVTEENALRRRHASETKKETDSWEKKRRKMNESLVTAKSAEQTKLLKKMYNESQHDHRMSLSLLNVNLRADLSRRALRHEPLGEDLDGRIYFVLSPRPIDEDGRPPAAWASGLLVWGPAVPSTKTEDVDDLPPTVPRWSHFGKSKGLKLLIKWLQWRFKQAKTTAPKAKKRLTLEVVLPSRSTQRHNSLDSGSSLSSLSEDEDWGELISPSDYCPSSDVIAETGRILVERLQEVAEWLEVLEWKGQGEVH